MNKSSGRYGHLERAAIGKAIDVLHTLTSFETFDALTGTSRSPEDATLLIRLAHGVVVGPDSP